MRFCNWYQLSRSCSRDTMARQPTTGTKLTATSAMSGSVTNNW